MNLLESSDDAARLKTAFNVVEKLMTIVALLKRSSDITMLLGSRIKSTQVLNVPGIGYYRCLPPSLLRDTLSSKVFR